MHERHGWYVADAPAKVEGICALIEESGLRPRQILDVGCGSGHVLAGVCARLGVPGVGVEPDPEAVALGLEHEGIAIRQGTLADAGRAELVLCIDVFEHLPDDRAFLTALLAHGDWFLFRIPLDESVWDRLRGRTERFRTEYGHIHAYTWGSAVGLLRRSGYDVRQVRPHRIPVGGLPDRLRAVSGALAPRLATRVLGGWSLLVLARGPR